MKNEDFFVVFLFHGRGEKADDPQVTGEAKKEKKKAEKSMRFASVN